MSYKDLDLQNRPGSFDSTRDNLIRDFYIPCLSQAQRYRRVAGFFNSASFWAAITGIRRLISNGGKIQLVCNVHVNSQDVKDLEVYARHMQEDFVDNVDADDTQLSLLGYLLKEQILEMKIAIVPTGILHSKWGIFTDSEDNHILFTGSENETYSGWSRHSERFDTHLSWIESDYNRFVQPSLNDWDAVWYDRAENVKVIPVLEALKRKLIQVAADGPQQATRIDERLEREALQKIKLGRELATELVNEKLRPYQHEAVVEWMFNERNGLFHMATGTGKTIAAKACIRVHSSRTNGVVVVAAPTQLLVRQWVSSLNKSGIYDVIEVMDSKHKWIQNLRTRIQRRNMGLDETVVIVATYKSFSDDDFQTILQDSGQEILLIADEVHHSWTRSVRRHLDSKFKFRLGLSATPELFFDKDGTKAMQDYFGGVVFRFAISDAIPQYLSRYEYYVRVAFLSQEELERFRRLSARIASIISSNKGKVDNRVLALLMKRARLVSGSENKLPVLDSLLDDLRPLKRTIVYCSPRQISDIKRLLRSKDIRAHQITYQEPLQQRKRLIQQFLDKRLDAIIAMKVLDEGIDVPGIWSGIICASSSNPNEYVQRRGRILRKSDDCPLPSIYDILIIPHDNWDEYSDSDTHLLRKELKRIEEFASTAENGDKAINELHPLFNVLKQNGETKNQ